MCRVLIVNTNKQTHTHTHTCWYIMYCVSHLIVYDFYIAFLLPIPFLWQLTRRIRDMACVTVTWPFFLPLPLPVLLPLLCSRFLPSHRHAH